LLKKHLFRRRGWDMFFSIKLQHGHKRHTCMFSSSFYTWTSITIYIYIIWVYIYIYIYRPKTCFYCYMFTHLFSTPLFLLFPDPVFCIQFPVCRSLGTMATQCCSAMRRLKKDNNISHILSRMSSHGKTSPAMNLHDRSFINEPAGGGRRVPSIDGGSQKSPRGIHDSDTEYKYIYIYMQGQNLGAWYLHTRTAGKPNDPR